VHVGHAGEHHGVRLAVALRAASELAWNVRTAPSSSAAAHTATAVPDSISEPDASTPLAPQPTRARGRSASCTPSRSASGAAR